MDASYNRHIWILIESTVETMIFHQQLSQVQVYSIYPNRKLKCLKQVPKTRFEYTNSVNESMKHLRVINSNIIRCSLL